MSKAEIERFIGDLKGDTALLDEVKSGAAGLNAVVETAKAKGYDITVDEAKAYISDQAKQELSDEQLDAVAGGKGHHHHSTTTATVQSVSMATTEMAAAETTIAAAAEVAAAAVAVVVAT